MRVGAPLGVKLKLSRAPQCGPPEVLSSTVMTPASVGQSSASPWPWPISRPLVVLQSIVPVSVACLTSFSME